MPRERIGVPALADNRFETQLSAHRLRWCAGAVRDAAAALGVRANAVVWQSPAVAAHVSDQAARLAAQLRAAADRLDAQATALDRSPVPR